MVTYEKLRIRAKLLLQVGAHLGAPEQIEVPIASARGNHDENGIPFCVVSVATGRDATLADQLAGLSPIHLKGNLIRLPTRALLQLQVSRDDYAGDLDQTWPAGWFDVFDGWVSDMSPSVSMGGSTVTLRLSHWLSDLDFSSPYSEDAFPTTPADFLFSAATVHGTGANRVVVGSTAVNKALSSFTSQSILVDFWDDSEGSGLRPFLQAISSERMMNWKQIQRFTGVTGPAGQRTNNLMQSALNRFEPFFDEESGFSLYEYGTSLSLRPDLDGIGQIANRIRQQATAAAYSPMFLGATMWDRMVSGMTSQYMFSIIPMVDRVLTVPYTPWLQDTWASIWSNEFDVMDYSVQARRPIRAVAVVGAYGSWTGLRADQQAGGPSNGERQVMGYYEPPATPTGATKDGMTMYVEAPAWINDLLMHGVSNQTAPLSGAIPMAQAAIAAGAEAAANLQATISDKKKSGVALANALAKATFLQEATKWRQAVISTALRFDIAPGSSIRIYSSPDQMVSRLLRNSGLDDSEIMVGRVVRVSWSVDLSGQSPSAATVFHIAYLRSIRENDDAAFAANDHPLWRSTWKGAPLVGMPEFSH